MVRWRCWWGALTLAASWWLTSQRVDTFTLRPEATAVDRQRRRSTGIGRRLSSGDIGPSPGNWSHGEVDLEHDNLLDQAVTHPEEGLALRQTSEFAYDGQSLGKLMESFDFATNISYFYLRHEVGLSDDTMWKIANEAGSALGMRAETIRRKVECLRRSLDLSDEDVRLILERQPTILHLSADNNIAPKVQFLMRALDMEKAELRSITRVAPHVICYATENLQEKIDFFTRSLGLNIAETRSLLLHEPRLFCAGVKSGLLPHVRFLRRDLMIPADTLRRIVKKHPRILLYSINDNLVPKLIFYCITLLGMNAAQLQKLLLVYPTFLNYNLDRHIQPITEYFTQELDMAPDEFRTILLKFPRTISYSLAKIKSIARYLRFGIGLRGFDVKLVLLRAPQVIGLSLTSLEGKVQYIERELKLSPEEIRRLVTRIPSVLWYSIDKNLQPKIDFLRQSFGVNGDALLRESIIKLPALLGYSLDKRIRPRMAALLEEGIDPAKITVAIPMGEERFQLWLSRRAEKGASEQSSAIVLYGTTTPARDDERITHWMRPRSGTSVEAE